MRSIHLYLLLFRTSRNEVAVLLMQCIDQVLRVFYRLILPLRNYGHWSNNTKESREGFISDFDLFYEAFDVSMPQFAIVLASLEEIEKVKFIDQVLEPIYVGGHLLPGVLRKKVSSGNIDPKLGINQCLDWIDSSLNYGRYFYLFKTLNQALGFRYMRSLMSLNSWFPL